MTSNGTRKRTVSGKSIADSNVARIAKSTAPAVRVDHANISSPANRLEDTAGLLEFILQLSNNICLVPFADALFPVLGRTISILRASLVWALVA